MKRHITVALIALNIVACFAAPQNSVAVEQAAEGAVSIVSEKLKGDGSLLTDYQNDQMIRTCVNYECKVMSAGDAKALNAESIQAVFAMKGDAELTKALSPSVDTLSESMKGLDAQKAMLENLQREMASLSNSFNKGQQAAEQAKGQFAAMMTKGISFAPEPSKGLAAAPQPSKGFAAAMPPSKGGSQANTMALEAAMCPMTMYELGKCQKLGAETRSQMQSANAMNAMLMSKKSELENQLAVTQIQKQKAEEQAAFNAKYAAEQKSQKEMFQIALAQANQQKAQVEAQKAELEQALAATQNALIQEKQTNQALTSALQSCNEDKATLEEEKQALIQELQSTQNALRQTQRALENEQNAHARTQRQLAATQQELEATEAARKQLEEAKQQLEDELAETKNQLDSMTAERDQLQETLDATSAMLAECNEDKLQCQADLTMEIAKNNMLTSQLTDAMTMLANEKAAREELLKTIMDVKAASEKVQEEVRKLQLENVQLQQQVMKLKSEQEAALAMAAGCPPTYEKFGLSCYKYVREKTQWKMAQEQCMKDGGNLVSIETKREQAFLVDYLKRHEARFDDKYLHLGGFDYNADGVFKWLSSKEPVNFGDTFWLQNNPRGMGRRCLAFQTWDMSVFGEWADEFCWISLPFVCEVITAPFM